MEKTTNYPYIASCVWSYPGYAVDVVGSKFNMPTIEVVRKIVAYVCEYYKTPVPMLSDKKRDTEFVKPRHIAMFFIFTYTDISQKYIGNHFGGRDHSTVVNARKSVKNQMQSNEEYRAQVIDIHNNLTKMVPVLLSNDRPSFDEVLAETVSIKRLTKTPFK
jgi:hypothetical protein